MGIKSYRPLTPGQRGKTTVDFSHLDKRAPEKSLTKGLSYKAGRSGRISVRRKGGRHKRLYRIIDFARNKINIPGIVQSIEYDPNRSANIALIYYRDGEKRYILAPKGLKVGATVLSGDDSPPTVGNCVALENIPLGSMVHNIELTAQKGGQLVRSAGTAATLTAKSGKYVTIRLPSGEVRMISKGCRATIGELGNEDLMNVKLGKAGRATYLGRRPKVRGVVQNPVDHPHGGGEGKSSGGRHPVTPWGKPTKGYKTRTKRKSSSKLIVKRRRG